MSALLRPSSRVEPAAASALTPRRGGSDASPERLVAAEGLGVRRSGHWLIRDVDIEVAPGRIVSLIGPNGAGKTTTIRALLGIEAPSAGVVRRAPGLRVGYVPQRIAVDHTLPLGVRHLMRLTRHYSDSVIAEALEAVGMSHRIDAAVRTLSGGEFQRVLLARAIVGSPDLLVLDEPVQGVDFAGEIALYRLIREIRDRLGCGVLMVTHDLHVVMAETDTVVCLNGHVCCSGPPRTVAGSPAFHALFGDRAAGVLAVYSHHHDHSHDPASDQARDHAHDHAHHHAHHHAEGDGRDPAAGGA
ncbi:MAG: metal ABC transporter ATP-binding protein [Azospirillaceae bacterium]